MILAAFDFETTGVNPAEDRIREVGLALYSTGRERIFEQTSFLVTDTDKVIEGEAAATCRIDQDLADAKGYSQGDAVEACVEYFNAADAVIGHNITWFDYPLLRATAKRLGLIVPEKIAIDTMTDIPGVKGKSLVTMCAEAKDPATGRDVSFTFEKHCALDDARAVIRLTSWHETDRLVERASSPLVLINSCQPNQKAANKVARKNGFRWNGDYKFWWRIVKDMDVPELQQSLPFPIIYGDKSIPLEYLRDS